MYHLACALPFALSAHLLACLLLSACANPAAEPCPTCQHRVYRQKRRRVMKAATTSSSGWGLLYFKCEFCSHTHEEKFTIALISTASDSSSGSRSSSGSSSSSSRSSSSSGGASGGGGAGSSW